MAEADAVEDFDKLFDEMADAKVKGETVAPEAPEGGTKTEDDKADQGGDKKDPEDKDKSADESEGADEGDTDEGDEEDAGEKGASADADANKDADKDKKDPATAQADAEKVDWSKLTPEQQLAAFNAAQDQIAALTHTAKSSRGRISALSRIRNLDSKVSALRANGADTKTLHAEVDKYLKSDSFKKFEDENPELAEPLKALAGTMSAISGKLADSLSAHTNETRKEVVREHGAYILQQHPDYSKVIGEGSKEQATKFDAWVRSPSTPDWVRDYVTENKDAITNGAHVVEVIDLYKTQHIKDFAGQGKGREPAGKGNGADAGQGNNSPDDVLRKRRQQAGSAAPQGGAGAGSGPANEFDAAFAFFSDKKDKERKRA